VSSNAVRIDEINFAEFVQLNDFDNLRLLSLRPPDGEFTLLNYRTKGEYFQLRMPFRIQPYVSVVDKHKFELVVKVIHNS
jgi:AP-4 complex subunit mu-1